MKTRLLLLAAFAAANLAPAAAPATPACCAVLKPANPVALSSRSIYQVDATWVDDGNAPQTLAVLRGQPVIVAMFFAQCEYACPMLVSDIQRVRAALPAEVRAKTKVVLVTFDTARDTPAALKAYRERLQLDRNWILLRGDPMAVQDLAMVLGVKFKRDDRGQFAHSNLITVLDAEGEIAHQRAGLMGDVSELVQAIVTRVK